MAATPTLPACRGGLCCVSLVITCAGTWACAISLRSVLVVLLFAQTAQQFARSWEPATECPRWTAEVAGGRDLNDVSCSRAQRASTAGGSNLRDWGWRRSGQNFVVKVALGLIVAHAPSRGNPCPRRIHSTGNSGAHVSLVLGSRARRAEPRCGRANLGRRWRSGARGAEKKGSAVPLPVLASRGEDAQSLGTHGRSL